MRTNDEMQHTLRTLEKTFNVDISQAKLLREDALEIWLEQKEKELFDSLSQQDDGPNPY